MFYKKYGQTQQEFNAIYQIDPFSISLFNTEYETHKGSKGGKSIRVKKSKKIYK
jgi:hypothetical protein